MLITHCNCKFLAQCHCQFCVLVFVAAFCDSHLFAELGWFVGYTYTRARTYTYTDACTYAYAFTYT